MMPNLPTLRQIAQRVSHALESLRDNGTMGGFHTADAEKCILCGYAKAHAAQLQELSCGMDCTVKEVGQRGEHTTLSDVLALLQRIERLEGACNAVWDDLYNDDGQCGLCGTDAVNGSISRERQLLHHEQWCPLHKIAAALAEGKDG